jgi:hypothetical protein
LTPNMLLQCLICTYRHESKLTLGDRFDIEEAKFSSTFMTDDAEPPALNHRSSTSYRVIIPGGRAVQTGPGPWSLSLEKPFPRQSICFPSPDVVSVYENLAESPFPASVSEYLVLATTNESLLLSIPPQGFPLCSGPLPVPVWLHPLQHMFSPKHMLEPNLLQ